MIDIAAKNVATPALVYVRTNGRVTPQIWHEPVSDIDGYWRGRIVAVRPLTSEMVGLPLPVLTKLFPPPALKEND